MKTFFIAPDEYHDDKGVETFEEVLERASSFWNDILSNPKYQDSTILVATHGATLRGLVCAFKENGVKDFWQGGVHKNCGMTIVEVKGKEKTVLQEAIILYDENDLK